MLHTLAAAGAFHDKSKTAFFIAAGVLVAWAIVLSVVGIRTVGFPSSKGQARLAVSVTAVLVALTAAMAVYTARTPPGVPPYNTGVTTNGYTPQATPLGKSSGPSSSTPPSGSAPSSGPLALSANPQGLLKFSTTKLVATSTHVVIVFTNHSPLPHNVTIANSAGKVLAHTPTFTGGTKTLTATLPAGTYTFYCSVPGHEAAGMKGTLTVR